MAAIDTGSLIDIDPTGIRPENQSRALECLGAITAPIALLRHDHRNWMLLNGDRIIECTGPVGDYDRHPTIRRLRVLVSLADDLTEFLLAIGVGHFDEIHTACADQVGMEAVRAAGVPSAKSLLSAVGWNPVMAVV